jgi:hypothetical protein
MFLGRYQSNKPTALPSNIDMAGYFGRRLFKSFDNRINNALFYEQWSLLVNFKDSWQQGLGSSVRITPPSDRFWADPFVLHRAGFYYVFFEELIYSRVRAHISVGVLDEHYNLHNVTEILTRPYHLSFPFIFTYDEVAYMVPESRENKTIELYRCERFPDKWQFCMNLMEDIEAVDTVLFPYQGKWWMFTNIKENKGCSLYDELSIFYSDNPLSNEWMPHQGNPVISDVRRARQAGNIFFSN